MKNGKKPKGKDNYYNRNRNRSQKNDMDNLKTSMAIILSGLKIFQTVLSIITWFKG